jgi:membrane protein
VVPNTKVRFRSALLGGTIAGMMWQTTSWAFASFVVSSASYSAIYSGFATIILFMIWLYLNWLILLIGAEISFCHQNLKFLTLKKEAFKLSHRLREKLCFIVTYLISFNYYYGKKPWTFELLVEHLGLPEEPIRNIITQLENSGLVVETADNPPGYIPARDIETIKLRDILKSIRGENTEESLWIESRFLSIPQVDQVMRRIDEAIEKALGKESIKDLVLLSRNGKEEKETPLTIY